MSDMQIGVGQMGNSRLAVLDHLVQILAADRPTISVLEVGSYEGGSALALSQSIMRHCSQGGTVLCIDPWKPYLPVEDVEQNPTCAAMQADLASGAVFERFLNNIKLADSQAPIKYMVGTLKQNLHLLAVDSFDFACIDGSHIFDDVFSDITLAKALVRPGGIMCGDDLEVQFPDALDCIQYKDREYVNGFHPGVTIAVWEHFGRVWCDSGVWAVHRRREWGHL